MTGNFWKQEVKDQTWAGFWVGQYSIFLMGHMVSSGAHAHLVFDPLPRFTITGTNMNRLSSFCLLALTVQSVCCLNFLISVAACLNYLKYNSEFQLNGSICSAVLSFSFCKKPKFKAWDRLELRDRRMSTDVHILVHPEIATC